MRRIILSLVMIVSAVGIVAGAAYAYFSATGSVQGNTVATGTLLLDVNEGAGKPVSISNIAPGYVDSTYRWFDAYNKGTLPAEFFLAFNMDSGDSALFDALVIELRDGGYTGACDGPAIYNGRLVDWITNTKISDKNVHSYVSDATVDAEKDNIRPNYTMRVCQKISLPESGSDQNELQGKSVTFTETVNSRQDKSPDLLP